MTYTASDAKQFRGPMARKMLDELRLIQAEFEECGGGGGSRCATFVIAANNSSELSKTGADYVCSGVNDDVQIQAAIDALPPSGGKVYMEAGEYNISATINCIKTPPLMLTGAGGFRGTFFKLADNANCDIFNINKMYLHISNIFMECNKENQTGIYHGLNISYVRYSYFDHLWIQDCSGNGIQIIPTAFTLDTHFMEINIENCDGIGWYIESGADHDHTLVRFFIEGGYSFGNEIGMYLNGTRIHHCAISNYDFEYNKKEGVILAGCRGTSINGGHIISNSIESPSIYSGVRLTSDFIGYGSHRNLISGVNFYCGATSSQKHCVYMELQSAENSVLSCNLNGGFSDSPIGSDGGESRGNNDVSDIHSSEPFLNNSGVSIPNGSIVILDVSDINGYSMKMTTVPNDSLVLGVVQKTVANETVGFVTKSGFTRYIRVNGTVDILAGDYITTSNVAGVGVKGTIGLGNCIAIALQNYFTDEESVIRARIIPPK